jgi:DNA-binding NarL/FixJ family response regulator
MVWGVLVLRILVVEDHVRLRRQVRSLLADAFPAANIVEAGSVARALLVGLGQRPWHLVVVDIGLPDGSGLEVVTALADASPTTPIVVISGLPRDVYEAPALEAGARRFIAKQDLADELVAFARENVETS